MHIHGGYLIAFPILPQMKKAPKGAFFVLSFRSCVRWIYIWWVIVIVIAIVIAVVVTRWRGRLLVSTISSLVISLFIILIAIFVVFVFFFSLLAGHTQNICEAREVVLESGFPSERALGLFC